MNIEINKAARNDTPVLRRLYELYEYDFSVYTHADVNTTGQYTDETFLTNYWRDTRWSSYLVRVDGRLAGFAWVLATTLFRPADVETHKDTRFLRETGFLTEPHHLI